MSTACCQPSVLVSTCLGIPPRGLYFVTADFAWGVCRRSIEGGMSDPGLEARVVYGARSLLTRTSWLF